jgi:hypothetical protein
MAKKKFQKGDLRYIDEEGKEYGISKRELGIMASGGNKEARDALERTKNYTFIYPDKILRELKSKGGLIKSGKPKVAKRAAGNPGGKPTNVQTFGVNI